MFTSMKFHDSYLHFFKQVNGSPPWMPSLADHQEYQKELIKKRIALDNDDGEKKKRAKELTERLTELEKQMPGVPETDRKAFLLFLELDSLTKERKSLTEKIESLKNMNPLQQGAQFLQQKISFQPNKDLKTIETLEENIEALETKLELIKQAIRDLQEPDEDSKKHQVHVFNIKAAAKDTAEYAWLQEYKKEQEVIKTELAFLDTPVDKDRAPPALAINEIDRALFHLTTIKKDEKSGEIIDTQLLQLQRPNEELTKQYPGLIQKIDRFNRDVKHLEQLQTQRLFQVDPSNDNKTAELERQIQNKYTQLREDLNELINYLRKSSIMTDYRLLTALKDPAWFNYFNTQLKKAGEAIVGAGDYQISDVSEENFSKLNSSFAITNYTAGGESYDFSVKGDDGESLNDFNDWDIERASQLFEKETGYPVSKALENSSDIVLCISIAFGLIGLAAYSAYKYLDNKKQSSGTQSNADLFKSKVTFRTPDEKKKFLECLGKARQERYQYEKTQKATKAGDLSAELQDAGEKTELSVSSPGFKNSQ